MSTDQANIDTWVLFIGPFDTRCMQSRLQIMMSDGNIFRAMPELLDRTFQHRGDSATEVRDRCFPESDARLPCGYWHDWVALWYLWCGDCTSLEAELGPLVVV